MAAWSRTARHQNEARDREPVRMPLGRLGRRALLQRILGFAVLILIIVWIVSDPASAGDTVHSWISGIITFFHHIA